jgi:hypothetical protein
MEPDRVDRDNPDLPLGRISLPPDLVQDSTIPCEQLLAALVVELSIFGDLQWAVAPVEKLQPKDLLKMGYLLTGSGLRNRQALGTFREAAPTNDLTEHLDSLEI